MKKSLFINEFKGQQVLSFIWNGRPCWIAMQIGELLDYKEISKVISNCIKVERFDKGIEYDVIKGSELKVFKEMISKLDKNMLKQAPSIVVFFEEGLYGFLQYTRMPIGIDFRKWIRQEVLPQIRKTGTYNIDENNNLKDNSKDLSNVKDNLSFSDFSDLKGLSNMRFSSSYKPCKTSSDGFDLDKFSRFKDAVYAMGIFKELMDSSRVSNIEQLNFLRALFEECGMDLPILDI